MEVLAVVAVRMVPAHDPWLHWVSAVELGEVGDVGLELRIGGS